MSTTKERREAWKAISELFLDTEHDELSLQQISRSLEASGFSLTELEDIYADEVAPILFYNTYAPAGAWSGFDMEWLEDEILKRQRKPSLLDRVPALKRLRRRWVTRSTAEEWGRVKGLMRGRSVSVDVPH